MRADQVEALHQQRQALARQVQALLDTPEAQRPADPKQLRAWLRELKTAQEGLAQLNHLLERAERSADKDARTAKLAERLACDDQVVLGVIPKGIGTEVRVTMQTWKGRRTLDIRCYASPDGGEKKPTRKGLQVDVKRLPALVEALQRAEQHI